MLRVVQALQCAGQHEILHLRALNPHVSSTLADAAKDTPLSSGLSAAICSAARQPGPLATSAFKGPADLPRCSGVSAFAFQGTNAHVTLAAASPGGSLPVSAAANLPWERRRFWYLPEPHALLLRWLGGGGEAGAIALELQLSRPRLAYLTDHQVRRPHSTNAAIGQVHTPCLLSCLLRCCQRACILYDAASFVEPCQIHSTLGSRQDPACARCGKQETRTWQTAGMSAIICKPQLMVYHRACDWRCKTLPQTDWRMSASCARLIGSRVRRSWIGRCCRARRCSRPPARLARPWWPATASSRPSH